MGDNLPPGVTPSDIDRHFGEPDVHEVQGTVLVDVTINVPPHLSESEIEEDLMEAVEDCQFEEAIEAHVEHVGGK